MGLRRARRAAAVFEAVAGLVSATTTWTLNINGAFDPGEPPIAGVTVSLDDGVATQTYQTNQWGLYTFQVDATGTYTLTETDLGAYVTSTNAIPGSPSVTKVDNSTLTVDVTALNVTLGDNLFADALANEVTPSPARSLMT